MYDMMTPGPTQVRENVMAARSRKFQNPDQDAVLQNIIKRPAIFTAAFFIPTMNL